MINRSRFSLVVSLWAILLNKLNIHFALDSSFCTPFRSRSENMIIPRRRCQLANHLPSTLIHQTQHLTKKACLFIPLKIIYMITAYKQFLIRSVISCGKMMFSHMKYSHCSTHFGGQASSVFGTRDTCSNFIQD